MSFTFTTDAARSGHNPRAGGTGNGGNTFKGEKVELMRDWIGIDARAASGGRGPEEYTSMLFTLTGLPTGNYQYRSYSHDTETQHPEFEILVTDAGDTRMEGPFTMTASTNNANNSSPANPGLGEGPDVLSSTVNLPVKSDGTNPVLITYRLKEPAGATSVFGVNGFELTSGSVTQPETPLKFTAITRDSAPGRASPVLPDHEALIIGRRPCRRLRFPGHPAPARGGLRRPHAGQSATATGSSSGRGRRWFAVLLRSPAWPADFLRTSGSKVGFPFSVNLGMA